MPTTYQSPMIINNLRKIIAGHKTPPTAATADAKVDTPMMDQLSALFTSAKEAAVVEAIPERQALFDAQQGEARTKIKEQMIRFQADADEVIKRKEAFIQTFNNDMTMADHFFPRDTGQIAPPGRRHQQPTHTLQNTTTSWCPHHCIAGAGQHPRGTEQLIEGRATHTHVKHDQQRSFHSTGHQGMPEQPRHSPAASNSGTSHGERSTSGNHWHIPPSTAGSHQCSTRRTESTPSNTRPRSSGVRQRTRRRSTDNRISHNRGASRHAARNSRRRYGHRHSKGSSSLQSCKATCSRVRSQSQRVGKEGAVSQHHSGSSQGSRQGADPQTIHETNQLLQGNTIQHIQCKGHAGESREHVKRRQQQRAQQTQKEHKNAGHSQSTEQEEQPSLTHPAERMANSTPLELAILQTGYESGEKQRPKHPHCRPDRSSQHTTCTGPPQPFPLLRGRTQTKFSFALLSANHTIVFALHTRPATTFSSLLYNTSNMTYLCPRNAFNSNATAAISDSRQKPTQRTPSHNSGGDECEVHDSSASQHLGPTSTNASTTNSRMATGRTRRSTRSLVGMFEEIRHPVRHRNQAWKCTSAWNRWANRLSRCHTHGVLHQRGLPPPSPSFLEGA